jgi:hypothetical protein
MIAANTQTVPYRSLREIEAVVRSFQWCTLRRERWTHAAYLTVLLWYHLHLPWPQAEKLILEGIKRFNAAKGIKATLSGGYHETMTLFWIRIVRNYLGHVRTERLSILMLFNNLIANCGLAELPFEYYSRDRLWSPDARAGWIEPDLKPFE